MDFYLHMARSLERRLEKPSTTCEKMELARLKCRQLLRDIREYGIHHERVLSKRTRKGEHRIKNCVKYDMGGGYRLVTVMDGNHLIALFLGSHDETDRWFDRHKGDNFIVKHPMYSEEWICFPPDDNSSTSCSETKLLETDAYEVQLEAKLDETTLLAVFQGLNRNRPVTASEEV